MKVKDLLEIRKTEKSDVGVTPYIEIGDIDIESKQYAAKDKGSVPGAVTAYEGEILVSTVRPTRGAITIVREKQCAVSGAFAVLKANTVVCAPNYLFFLLNSKPFLEYLGKNSKGATYPTCSKEDVFSYEVKAIGLNEQQRIVEELDKLSIIIASRKQELLKLDELVKARFVEMFGDPEYNNKTWPIQTLDKLCTVGSSKRIYQDEQSSDGIPFWRISDLVSKMDTGVADSGLFIPKEKYNKLKIAGLVPATGDILVTSRGTLGRCYIVKHDDQFYFQDGMISWLSGYSESITPLYLQYLFTMPSFRKQIDSMQTGSTVVYLSIAMLKRLRVMVPSKDTQDSFTTFVKQVDKSKAVFQKALDVTQLLFDSLMQQYFG